MLKKFSGFTAVSFIALTFLFAFKALAATPTISVANTGDGDSVEINVIGDPNKGVVLTYLKTNVGQQLSYLGSTNSNGKFNTVLSTAAFGITPGSQVYVTVNGQQSPATTWPSVAVGSSLSLSQTGIVLPIGQSTTINAYNNGTSLLFLSSNSNPPVVNVNINGNQIGITGNNYGSSLITICSVSNLSSCASAYVTVQNTGSKPVVFSQNSIGVTSGKTAAVSIMGGTGAYVLFNNSNPNSIQANLNGSTVNLSTAASEGNSSITICSSDMSSCGVINAAVGNVSASALSFSQANPSMSAGQNLVIGISGSSGSYSVFSNSNTSSVQANLSGSNLTLSAAAGGQSTIIICSSLGSCGAVSATVSYTANGGGAIKLSQNNLWLMIGQTLSIGITGGKMPYSLVGASSNLQTSLSDSTLTITGLASGSTAINVCSAAGACTTLSVLVNGLTPNTSNSNTNTNNTNTNTNTNTNISVSPSSASLEIGDNLLLSIAGGGGYYVSSYSSQNIATIAINGNSATISAFGSGTTNATICQTSGQCTVLPIIVKAPKVSSPAVPAIPNKPATPPATKPATSVAKYKFTRQITYGATGKDVTELQKRLKTEGYYNGPVTGRYLSVTLTAIKKYQKIKKIRQTGTVGPQTLAALNK